MRKWVLAALVLSLAPLALLAQTPPAPPTSTPPAPRAGQPVGPAKTGPAARTTSNLSLQDQAVAAVDAGTLANFQTEVERQAKAAITVTKTFDPAAAAKLSAYREFARYFGATSDLPVPQKQTLKWLVTRERMLETVMSAVAKEQPARDLLDRLTSFATDSAQNCEAFPDLTTALLVVPNQNPYQQIRITAPDTGTPLRLFHYYTNPKTTLQMPVRDLPWQLAIYVVDNKLSDSDMQWAVQRFARRQQIGTIYFDVPYDTSAYLNGASRQIESRAYTLPNLQQYGGVCIDQAFFATQIAKTFGVPACICTGEGGAGQVAHAWVGFLQIINRRAKWNFDEGRYADMLFWSAQIVDPQTQEVISDADVALLAELQNVTRDARLQSALLLKLIDLVDPAQQTDYYERVIHLSPGNRAAWLGLAKTAGEGKLTPAQSEQVAQVVKMYAVKTYPDFGYSILVKMASGNPPEAQVKALDRIATFFPDRPDLLARIRLLQGNLLEESKKTPDALKAYGDVLTKDLNAGPIVLDAMQKVDRILRDQKDLPRLAKIYDQVWHHMPAPDPSSFASHTPYYELSKQYALLLDDIGNKSEADVVRARLATLSTSLAPKH